MPRRAIKFDWTEWPVVIAHQSAKETCQSGTYADAAVRVETSRECCPEQGCTALLLLKTSCNRVSGSHSQPSTWHSAWQGLLGWKLCDQAKRVQDPQPAGGLSLALAAPCNCHSAARWGLSQPRVRSQQQQRSADTCLTDSQGRTRLLPELRGRLRGTCCVAARCCRHYKLQMSIARWFM
jgi:hypothetical protein